ncbi:MAG: DNA topoisomerase IV subunit B [Alphaproteobacteria bacterium]|nr:DNA topoisomerase IV subunit B [Alphaproteobacteria bacterium]
MAKKKSADLFDDAPATASDAKTPAKQKKAPVKKAAEKGYSAADIEVLEGLEPVRRRPGMYIGGTDSRAMHHLFAEVIDNSMDEAVAGHATFIEVEFMAGNRLSVRDNGRGIPVDPHPKYKDKSALEVIMTTLHAGGKFGGDAYDTSGGLHGVGVSVVNALASELVVEVARDQQLHRQEFSRGLSQGKVRKVGEAKNKRGTTVSFVPDEDIFDKIQFDAVRLYAMAKAKAYLFGGVVIRWKCDPSLIKDQEKCPTEDTLKFPNGLQDYLEEQIGGRAVVTPQPFAGKVQKTGGHGSCEWAVTWVAAGIGNADGMNASYCNTVPTPEGGTHEQGMRAALTKGLKAYGDRVNNKKASIITGEDVMGTAAALVSVFVREPEFQGQTKDKLATPEAAKIVETTLRDHFEHYLTSAPADADKLLGWVIDRAEERVKRRQEKEVSRKSAVRKLRLPGKLADCSQNSSEGAELFIVEGDSAGGSAKQGRNRKNQAILPLRGKILNVANATAAKMQQSQQIADLVLALGCGMGASYDEARLRYEKIIIMTDADVDGAHIAALLVTFFHEQMPELIRQGHLYIAVPPLYRLAQGAKTFYARDDEHREELLKTEFRANAKVDISRFKGLGEMLPAQLKETTMLPGKRTLLQVHIPDEESKATEKAVKDLMGNKPELRFKFIQENAAFAGEDLLDI